MYNMIEFSYSYFDTTGSLWQFKKDDQNMDNGNLDNVTAAVSTSFKYKSSWSIGVMEYLRM